MFKGLCDWYHAILRYFSISTAQNFFYVYNFKCCAVILFIFKFVFLYLNIFFSICINLYTEKSND